MAADRQRLLTIMEFHRGRRYSLGMAELYRQVYGVTVAHKINETRRLRGLIRSLQQEGIPILSSCGAADGGYWLAETPEELAEFCRKEHGKALGILIKESRIRRIALPELLGQLALELKEKEALATDTIG